MTRPNRPLRRTALGVVLAILALVLSTSPLAGASTTSPQPAVAQTAAAQTSTSQKSTSAKPTIVLVHGAWARLTAPSSSWGTPMAAR